MVDSVRKQVHYWFMTSSAVKKLESRKGGRPRSLSLGQCRQIALDYVMYEGASTRSLADHYGVSHNTIARAIRWVDAQEKE